MKSIFFEETYRNYHTNGANRSYWAKYFRDIANRLREVNKAHLFSSFNENMPIYEYYSTSKNRFVRVMQYDPHNEDIEGEKYGTDRFYTAWTDERLISDDFIVPELVVCLLMTKANVGKAEMLINTWLFETIEKTKEMIDEIYEQQERMEKRERK